MTAEKQNKGVSLFDGMYYINNVQWSSFINVD